MPGPITENGTRMPPSVRSHFPLSSGALSPALYGCPLLTWIGRQGIPPLSEVNIRYVLSARPIES